MNPELKAKELVEKFNAIDCDVDDCDLLICPTAAKQCALIVADAMIELLGRMANYWPIHNGEWYDDEFKKLQQVKQAIEKM